jgi:hypothetical protein
MSDFTIFNDIPIDIIIDEFKKLHPQSIEYYFLSSEIKERFINFNFDDKVKFMKENPEFLVPVIVNLWKEELIPGKLRGRDNKHSALTFMLSNSGTELLKVVGQIYEKCDEYELFYIKKYMEMFGKKHGIYQNNV